MHYVDMSRRALLVAFHFPPQAASSGVQRTLSFSKYLGNFGWSPIILTASPLAYGEKNGLQLYELPSSLVVRRVFALDTKRHFGVRGRYFDVLALPDRWVSWCLSAIPLGYLMIRKYKPAVIMATYPIPTALLIGLILHRLTGIPWIADFRDPMLQDDYPGTRLQRKAYQWIEEQVFCTCKKAIFTTSGTMEYYRQRYPDIPAEKFAVIENGYDEDGFKAVASEQSIRPTQSTACVTLLHSGTLYSNDRDPSAFVQAIAKLKLVGQVDASSLRIILRGTGDDHYFNAMVRSHGVEDIIRIEKAVPYYAALQEMQNVDGLLVFQGPTVNTQVPAKVYEYFRAKKPILGLLDLTGETAKILAREGFQDLAKIDSVPSIMCALEKFLSRVRGGCAHVASDVLIAESCRKHRTFELAQVFEQVSIKSNA